MFRRMKRRNFWDKLAEFTGVGCWLWDGARSGNYGYASIDGRKGVQVHRLAYEKLRGPIADGMVIDHLCNNTLCMNPWHMRVCTQRENVLRGSGPSADNSRKDKCKNGHPYDTKNGRGDRVCSVCRRAARRRHEAKSRR